MASLNFVAIRNLLHDRVRFLITLAGVAVAIVLIFLQGGMYLGFMSNASATIDHSRADLWIVENPFRRFHGNRARKVRLHEPAPLLARINDVLDVAIWQGRKIAKQVGPPVTASELR